MPALLYAQGALDDLHRLSEFLQGEDSAAAGATAALVMRGLEILEAHPLIGRPIGAGLYELILSRGNTGYVAVYEYQPRRERVLVLAIRHQRKAGFEE